MNHGYAFHVVNKTCKDDVFFPVFTKDIHANIEEWCQLKARTLTRFVFD
jgi:hypothetical protein